MHASKSACAPLCCKSRGIKRDKLNGTNRAKFAVFRRFSLIFADFLFFWGITALRRRRFSQKTAGNRTFSQETADFRRNPFVPLVKACAVRPVFAPVVGELRAADPSNLQGPVKQNASPGEQSEAPRPRRKPGQEQNPGPENQDSQHMLEQPRGHFPEQRRPAERGFGRKFLFFSQPQSITQKGVHAHPLTAWEREHWFL